MAFDLRRGVRGAGRPAPDVSVLYSTLSMASKLNSKRVKPRPSRLETKREDVLQLAVEAGAAGCVFRAHRAGLATHGRQSVARDVLALKGRPSKA